MTCRVGMAALLAVLASPPMALGAQANPSVLTMTGFGRAALKPSRARLNVSVEARSSSAMEAADSNDHRLAAILARFKAMPWLDSVRVTSVSITPLTDGFRDAFSGYYAMASVQARLLDLTKLASVLDAAIASGATSLGQVRFEADSMDVARRRALGDAFRNAHADAAALAQASGARLGRLIRVTTGAGQQFIGSNSFEQASVMVGPSSGDFGNAEAGIISIAADPNDVSATAAVTAEWQLAP